MTRQRRLSVVPTKEAMGTGHLPGQGHDNLLKEQGKATARSCPRNCDPVGATVRATHSRHTRRQVAVMLEEVEVPPCEFQEVMRLAVSATARTGMAGASVGAERQMEFVWEPSQCPAADSRCARAVSAPSQGRRYLLCACRPPPRGTATASQVGLGQFHVARRRTRI